ncbi:hypothetical protein [Sulfitobacter sp. S190]|uniref:hypothetical protein n=1 Tax=Sulfitobacter sp. S190 TaxID=2867022 RepID=UPI0021A51464|nr:hypothetical protein [Sulfitobacter sp. S190]UWR22671.1 hypothetical protein K3756_01345 [Sulfitobacter sp. S190]
MKVSAGRASLIGAVLAVAGCAQGAMETRFAEVDGFRVRVEQIAEMPTTYRASGATARDRATLGGAYYARNIIAIRRVAGCPVRPDRITHDADGPTSVAVVTC